MRCFSFELFKLNSNLNIEYFEEKTGTEMSGMAEIEDPSRRNELEEEMSRFEQEIAEHPISRPVIATNTFRMASQAIQNAATVPEVKPQQEMPNNQHFVQGAHPRPLLRPSNPNLRPTVVQGTLNQVRPHMQGPIRHPVQAPPNQLRGPRIPHTMTLPPRMPPMVPQMVPNPGAMPVMGPVAVPMVPVPMPVPLPGMPVAGPVGATAVPVMTPEEQKEWGSTYSQAGNSEAKDKKKPKEKKFLRVAGNQVWEDSSLAEWENDDFRVFCGDLGNEVTDEILTRTFAKYPSLLRAKVVRDKKTNKSKGYGFLSFKDPNDFVKAMKEMNGKYIGNRPIKLRKSTWKDRSIEAVKKKSKEKKRLGYR